MRWEVVVSGDDAGTLTSSITVEADSWFEALRSGLRGYGMDGQAVSNLTSEKREDGTYCITDYVTGRAYQLRKVDDSPDLLAASEQTDPLDSQGFLHSEFRVRDESPEDARGVFIRERFICVPQGTPRHDAEALAREVFAELQALNGKEHPRRMISVQVFDHEFDQQSERPAIAVLRWKSWDGDVAVHYPLSGEGDQLRTFLLGDSDDGAIADGEIADGSETPAPEPIDLVERAPIDLLDRVVEAPPAEEAAVDDLVMIAFGQMQPMYGLKGHNRVAKFALDVCTDLIPCAAGTAMLITPGRYELYLAAAVGDMAADIGSRERSLGQGVLGFAARTGAVVSVSHPAEDDRFDPTIDSVTETETRNLLCVPMQYEGKLVGIIELLNSDRNTGFSEEESHVLSYVAGAVAEYIETSLPSREREFKSSEFAEFIPPPQKIENPLRRISKLPRRISKFPAKLTKAKPAGGKPAGGKPTKGKPTKRKPAKAQ